MVKLENINIEEKEAIETLRKRMQGSLKADMYEDDLLFYRYLKARNFDVNKAESMLRECLQFRKQFQFDTILQDFVPNEVFLKYVGGNVIGTDKDGNLLIYIALGKIQILDIIRCYKYHTFLKHLAWNVEFFAAALKEETLKTERNRSKYIYILDLDKLELLNTCHPLSIKLLVYVCIKYQIVFPETLKAVYVINAPTYYTYAFFLMKRVLDNGVIKKIHFFGRNGWREELLKCIEADVLPAFLGGSRTDPDGNPMCNTIVSHAGKVPEKFYLTEKDKMFQNMSQVKHASIHAGKTHEVFVDVDHCGSIIRWELEVPKSDIRFGLFLKQSEEERKEIIPICMFETLNGPENDSYRCQSSGTYIIVFDNTYSWLYKKELSYCITVINPDKDLSNGD